MMQVKPTQVIELTWEELTIIRRALYEYYVPDARQSLNAIDESKMRKDQVELLRKFPTLRPWPYVVPRGSEIEGYVYEKPPHNPEHDAKWDKIMGALNHTEAAPLKKRKEQNK